MLKSKIESLLFISPRPLSVAKIAQLTGSDKDEVKTALSELMKEFNDRAGGIQLVKNFWDYQMTTTPNNSKLVKDFIKDEISGELTKPSLEALAIIVYRAPITKPELEQIRGVNCSLILRNLMIRGLAEQEEDKKTKLIYYKPTFEFLKFLGVHEASELPNFEKLNSDENLQKLLDIRLTPPPAAPAVDKEPII
ncbi:MAG: SMC-Scp complex subunit ScpB [Patescibacteria group bacterium]|nr:SMC-Scp complex subunit ScpB [Patescibacteria group bacterium]MDD5490221.1 SMC-Scp complex subunit ScpB [Patescibacteria group bacterium]